MEVHQTGRELAQVATERDNAARGRPRARSRRELDPTVTEVVFESFVLVHRNDLRMRATTTLLFGYLRDEPLHAPVGRGRDKMHNPHPMILGGTGVPLEGTGCTTVGSVTPEKRRILNSANASRGTA